MAHFDADRSDVISRARNEGVSTLITIGTDLEDSKRAVALAEEYQFIFAAVGIHPHDVNNVDNVITTYDIIKSLAHHDKVVAIGETGLDYHYLHSPAHVQKEHFRRMINLAGTTDLPLIIHSRDAKEDTLKILKEEWGEKTRGVFHCFSGDIEMAERALELGFYISFSGVVTFKNSRIIDILKAIPLDRILIETDSPYLTPHPFRGRRNEPAYVRYVAEKVAEIKGISLEEICMQIMNNAVSLFKLIQPY